MCILVLQCLGQGIPDVTQQFIARGMAAGIVDDFELIQVEVQQHMLLFIFSSRLNGSFYRTLEFLTIHQLSEVVVSRLIGQFVVHVFQHALRSTFHQRQVVVVQQRDASFVQAVRHVFEDHFAILDALAIDQHERTRIITNKRNVQDQRPPIRVAGG